MSIRLTNMPQEYGGIGEIFEKHQACADIQENGAHVSFHLNSGSNGDEVLIGQTDTIQFFISKELLDQCGNQVDKVAEYINTHATLFLAPLFLTHNVSLNNVTSIGKGNNGTVYSISEIAIDTLNKFQVDLALKIPGNDRLAINEFETEVAFLHELHKRLTPEERFKVFPDVYEVTHKGMKGFLMERYSETLDSYLQNHALSLEEKLQIATQLIEQMAIFAKYGAIYTDIKPKNVLIKPGPPFKVKFADFGNCHFIDKIGQNPPSGFTLTHDRTSASDDDELFDALDNLDTQQLQITSHHHYCRAVGLLLCTLFSGQPTTPFSRQYSFNQLREYVRSQDPLESLREKTPLLYDVVVLMLGLNPDGRQISPEGAILEWNKKLLAPELA